MRILITNLVLDGRTGTETYVRDLAFGLRDAGCTPIVYSTQIGQMGSEIARQGIEVTSWLGSLDSPPDIIHGHHNLPLLEAMGRFRRVPAVFVCHDRVAWHDRPPLIPGIRQYVAVDMNCRERLVAEGVKPGNQIRVILNSVDTSRFRPRPILPSAPRRALVFGGRFSGPARITPLREACASLGIGLETLGSGSGNEASHPELLLPDYDVVFAKARCALEALATGCAVVLCDVAGLGPMVTRDQLCELRAWNFGERLLAAPIEARAVGREIARYDPVDAARVRDYIREEASLEEMIKNYLDLYREVMGERQVGGWPTDEELRGWEFAIKQLRSTSSIPQDGLSLSFLARIGKRVIKQPGCYLRRALIDGEIRRIAPFFKRPGSKINGK